MYSNRATYECPAPVCGQVNDQHSKLGLAGNTLIVKTDTGAYEQELCQFP